MLCFVRFIDPFNVNSTEATISLALPTMFDSDQLNTTWAAAAAGEYDGNWRQTADSICNLYHKCDLLVRPAWEMNGNWSEQLRPPQLLAQ